MFLVDPLNIPLHIASLLWYLYPRSTAFHPNHLQARYGLIILFILPTSENPRRNTSFSFHRQFPWISQQLSPNHPTIGLPGLPVAAPGRAAEARGGNVTSEGWGATWRIDGDLPSKNETLLTLLFGGKIDVFDIVRTFT